LTEVDNKQPFTLTAKVTPTFLKTYDAGTLYIYVKEDLWLKMAMEMDERQKTKIISVRTIGTSDDDNHDVIEAKSVHMKISSDTKTVGFYYSLDKKSWQLIRSSATCSPRYPSACAHGSPSSCAGSSMTRRPRRHTSGSTT
jgi:regulation of enolase protein 1 (concanavalin A-like superfamily)